MFGGRVPEGDCGGRELPLLCANGQVGGEIAIGEAEKAPAILIGQRPFGGPGFSLPIDAAFDGAEHFVAGAEHTTKELEFLVQQLVHANLRLVFQVEEIDDGDIDFLAVTMAAADALFHTLRIPRQVEVDYERAELQVD